MTPFLIILLTFLATEGLAWFIHKYIMHGLLWSLHEDHHNPTGHHLQRNDTFFLIFALPSAILAIVGLMDGVPDYRVWISIGIGLYGLTYFLVHDVFIHQRFRLFKRSRNPYLIAIRKAHKVHHKYLDKADGECFGMLWVPWRYYREAWAYARKLNRS